MKKETMKLTPLSCSKMTDFELIDLALNNNSQAWREIVKRYHPKVKSLVFKLYGNTPEHEDIVQEIFIALAKSLKNFRKESSFYTFLYRIAINTAHTFIKKQKNIYFLSESFDFIADTHLKQDVENDEISNLLKRFLKNLPIKKRIALSLNVVENLTMQEISDILKIPLQTVASRVRSAKTELMELIIKQNKQGKK